MDVKSIRLLVYLAAMTLLSGCSTFHESPDTKQTIDVNVLEYQVRRGDTLARIAQRLTGDIDNWQSIARFNNLTDPMLIHSGSLLLIPAELLLAERLQSVQASKPRVALPQREIIQPKTVTTYSAGASVVFQPTEVPGALETPVATSPIQVNKQFQVTQVGAPTSKLDKGERVMIQVVGTYYPKGVYAQPFNHSPLIMRAEPGATFELNQELGDWLRINTEFGAGYIRAIDAKLVGAGYAGAQQSKANS